MKKLEAAAEPRDPSGPGDDDEFTVEGVPTSEKVCAFPDLLTFPALI